MPHFFFMFSGMFIPEISINNSAILFGDIYFFSSGNKLIVLRKYVGKQNSFGKRKF